MAYDWGQHVPEEPSFWDRNAPSEEVSAWDVPSPLDEEEPQFDYFTGGIPPGDPYWSNSGGTPSGDFSSYIPYGSDTGGNTPSGYNSSPTRWTVPSKQTGQTTTTTWQPTGTRPADFTAPEWDEGEISSLTQKRAASGIRNLRSAVQSAMTRSYESPQIRRMTLREALSGFGMGLENVMGGASKAATGEYGARYAREYQSAAMNWQSLWSEYMKTGKQVSKTDIQYGGDEGEQEKWSYGAFGRSSQKVIG